MLSSVANRWTVLWRFCGLRWSKLLMSYIKEASFHNSQSRLSFSRVQPLRGDDWYSSSVLSVVCFNGELMRLLEVDLVTRDIPELAIDTSEESTGVDAR